MKKIAILLSSLIIFSSGCSMFNKQSDVPVIKVNNTVITKGMFERELKTSLSNSIFAKDLDLNNPQTKFLYLIMKGQVVSKLINRELVAEEAAKKKIVISDKEIKKIEAQAASELGGKNKLEEELKTRNISRAEFAKRIKNEFYITKLVELKTGKNNISESEIRSFYNKNRTEKFYHPDTVKVSHILISFNNEAAMQDIKSKNPKISDTELNKKIQEELDKSKSRAEESLKELKANPDKFGEVAKKYSDDKLSAQSDGNLGNISKTDIDPAFAKAAFALKVGSVSELVKTKYGFHIIKVSGKEKAGYVTYNNAREEIKLYLFDKIKSDAFAEIMKEAKKSAKIVYLDPEYDPNTQFKKKEAKN